MSIELAASQSAHIIVVGNEKGGSGKSTVAMHIAVALIKSGQSVATIDLDFNKEASLIISGTGGSGLNTLAVIYKSPNIFALVKVITRRMPRDVRLSPMLLMHWRKGTALW